MTVWCISAGRSGTSRTKGYAKRLVQAHRLHQTVKGKDGGGSFGFLYAPPVEELTRQPRTEGTVAAGRRRDTGADAGATRQ